MNKAEGLQFRSFVPLLVANLEDADAGVREAAKSAVVELFRCVACTVMLCRAYAP